MLGGNIIKGIKEYIKNVNAYSPFLKTFIISIVGFMVLLSLDTFDVPSRLIIKLPIMYIIELAVGTILIIMLCLFYFHFFDSFKINSEIDTVVVECFFISIEGIAYWSVKDGVYNYKSLFSLIMLFLSIILLTIRIKQYSKLMRAKSENETNVFDLQSIYMDSFKVSKNQPILLSEKDVDYDLLDRKGIKNQFLSVIKNFNSDSSYVIGLIGEWGSGKTTLLNNIKAELVKEKSTIVIDDFDAWILGSQEALLFSMYEKILKYSGMKFSLSKNRKVINALKTIVSGMSSKVINNTNVLNAAKDILDIESYNEVAKLKNDIGFYLKANNKIVVFIIDNIDRADADNIILLFKLIGTVFDLPNILYILSFDKKRVDKLLSETTKIDPRYLEKIVQQEIFVPSVQPEVLEDIYSRCISNIIIKYGIDANDVSRFFPIIEWTCENVKDLRCFKRLINSAFVPAFLNENKLDLFSSLIIEIIRFLEPNLYASIYDNREYFISSDLLFNSYLFSEAYNQDAFNKKGKYYFDDLAKEYSSALKLLSNIFPYVKRYCSNQELKSGYYHSNEGFDHKFPIYSTKFFELYFSYGNNDFSILHTKVRNVVADINSVKDKNAIEKIITDNLINEKREYHQEIFTSLEEYLDDIPSDKCYHVLQVLWENIFKTDDSTQFLVLSARDRVLVIIARLLNAISVNDFNGMCKTCASDYSKINMLNRLKYWMNSSSKDILQERKELINKSFSELCEKVVKENIDLYDDKYYSHENIWGLINYYKEKDVELKPYFDSIYSDQKIYRLLADCISGKVGRIYIYSIKESYLKDVFIDRETVEKAFKSNPPKKESEYKIKEIYDASFYGEKNYFGETGLESPTPISFDSL